MKKIYLLLIASIFVLVLASCTQPTPSTPESTTLPEPQTVPTPTPAPAEEYEIKTDADGTKYIVHPAKIMGGGPPKDGIPAIDNPKFVSVAEADEWIEDNELVIAIIHKELKRVYPLQIMVWHEIVNETIGGDPLLITY
jgi:hypothetical protein